MFAKGKQLAGQSSLYTIGEVLRSSLSFLLLPIYTRLLSPADYAILGVMSPVFSLLSITMALGMPAALLRFYFDYKDDPAMLRRYVGTVTVFGIGCGLIGSILLTLLGPAIFGWLLPNTPFNPYVLITIWNAGISVVSVLVLQLFRARQQAKFFVTFSLVDFSLTTALIILLVVGLRLGALGSLWGQLLAAVAMAVPALWVLARAGRLGFLLAAAAALAGLRPAAAALSAGHLGAERLRPYRAGRAGVARGAGPLHAGLPVRRAAQYHRHGAEQRLAALLLPKRRRRRQRHTDWHVHHLPGGIDDAAGAGRGPAGAGGDPHHGRRQPTGLRPRLCPGSPRAMWRATCISSRSTACCSRSGPAGSPR